MKKIKEINWAILGCGKIAHKFAQDLLAVPNANLYAVASRSLKKASEFAKKYEADTCYGSYVKLCEDPKVDIVYIATPHSFHFEHAMLCLNNAKGVLCEKPFAMNSSQVLKMVQLAKEKNIFLMEALWTYFLPHYQYVLEVVNSKKYGELQHIKADFGYSFNFDVESRIYNKKLGGGSLLDIGIYPVFVALSLLGEPATIEAAATFTSTNVDETCSVNLSYANGAKAELYSSIIEKTPTEAILTFEKATLKVHSRFHEPSTISIYKNGKEELIAFEVSTNGYNFEAVHVTELLLNGKKESPVLSLKKSITLIRLLDTIREQIGLHY